MAMPPGPIRMTQRAPQSCQLCSIKKMKCSKQIPCTNCVNRGLQEQCRREAVIVYKRPPRRNANLENDGDANPSKKRKASQGATSGDYRQITIDGSREGQIIQNIWPQEHQQAREVQNSSTSQGGDYRQARQTSDTASAQRFSSTESQQLGALDEPQSLEYPYDGALSFFPDSAREKPPAGSLLQLLNAAEQTQRIAAAPENVNSPREEASIEQEVTISIESLTWSRQRDAHQDLERLPVNGLELPTSPEAIVSADQVQPILAYHKEAVAWIHNVLHMPTFFREYTELLQTQTVPNKSWLSLYFAILSTGLYHMSREQQRMLGFQDAAATSKRLYQAALNALHESDYMSTQSVYALQAICVVLLCANTFGDAKRMAALLGAATSIARDLGLHRLGPDSTTPQPTKKLVEREVAKRIWTFLTVQDWFLIPFKDSYSINPNHTSTPVPHNCNDDEMSFARDGFVNILDTSTPTQCSFTLLNYQVANVIRNFFDRSSPLGIATESLSKSNVLYEALLATDTALERLWKTFPSWVRDGTWANNRSAHHFAWQRRNFEISFNHKRLMVHRRFFLPSLKRKLYYYTRMTCLTSARTILNLYCSSRRDNELWTVFAHVTSAAVVVALSLLFNGSSTDTTQDWQLVQTCVAQLRDSELSSTISSRGVKIISYLLEYANNQSPNVGSPVPGVSKLLKDLEVYMSEDAMAGGGNTQFDFNLGTFNDSLYDFLEAFPLSEEFAQPECPTNL